MEREWEGERESKATWGTILAKPIECWTWMLSLFYENRIHFTRFISFSSCISSLRPSRRFRKLFLFRTGKFTHHNSHSQTHFVSVTVHRLISTHTQKMLAAIFAYCYWKSCRLLKIWICDFHAIYLLYFSELFRFLQPYWNWLKQQKIRTVRSMIDLWCGNKNNIESYSICNAFCHRANSFLNA